MIVSPMGVSALGEGVEIVTDDGSLALQCRLTAPVVDSEIIVVGVGLDVERPDDGTIDSSLLLNADECDALVELLRTASAALRDGSFEREVREQIDAENASES